MNFRKGNNTDLEKLRELGLKSWIQFKTDLTDDNWNSLFNTINNIDTYADLLSNSACFICESEANDVIGMAFIVPNGNPTDIYDEKWCHLRFVSVDPEHRGKGIGNKLTDLCIAHAKSNGETIMALHTSEIMETARHIYEKIGFTILRELDRRLGVRYWLYTLELKK
jgi:ribosomal protein S18 acetylase RimI-like enzyme